MLPSSGTNMLFSGGFRGRGGPQFLRSFGQPGGRSRSRSRSRSSSPNRGNSLGKPRSRRGLHSETRADAFNFKG
uniref:Myelin basic protein n=1 Tax=Strongyloides venezuelensis TaxID=75913 RepID=A0A0K0FHF0_STRVS